MLYIYFHTLYQYILYYLNKKESMIAFINFTQAKSSLLCYSPPFQGICQCSISFCAPNNVAIELRNASHVSAHVGYSDAALRFD